MQLSEIEWVPGEMVLMWDRFSDLDLMWDSLLNMFALNSQFSQWFSVRWPKMEAMRMKKSSGWEMKITTIEREWKRRSTMKRTWKRRAAILIWSRRKCWVGIKDGCGRDGCGGAWGREKARCAIYRERATWN